jgi:predicted nucleotidyltransferase
MVTPRRSNGKNISTRGRRSREDLLSEIRRWARQIVERFAPERIILFGSHAYGRPGRDSDVDVLVVMPAANEISQSIRLTLALEPSFPLDLIVRTPEHLRRGLRDGDSFLREIVTKGKLLYAQDDGQMGPQGRGRRQGRRRA